ncbi:MAG: translation initiation factor IF-2, partial [Pirellulaceae bacterium]|jgi:translation initiation factor IF-2|nr:translation initiation factor IF-2 [Pirellulaceae bacterium]
VIGFHVIALQAVRDVAEHRHVEIRTYRIIYELIDDVKMAMEGLLDPETQEQPIGEAEVRQVFRVSKTGMIAGCLVTEGSIQRGASARVVRDGVVVTEGRSIESVRRVKEDVREVRAGTECGIRVSGFDDVKPSDRLVCYKTVQVKRTLG